jgi:hypothetical protein
MSADIQTRVAPPADTRIAYGKDPSQFGDLRLPKGRDMHPLAIILHGGWWHSEADLGYLGHLAAALTAEGIATWNVEFRRLGAAGGGWPATFLDGAASADYVRALAATYSIDLTRVVPMDIRLVDISRCGWLHITGSLRGVRFTVSLRFRSAGRSQLRAQWTCGWRNRLDSVTDL